jgi:PadR family transcriptional regulator PadR
MDPQLKKGILDALVLSILRSGDTYGYELSENVSRIIDVAETALYPVLRRLESQQLLETYVVEHNGRLRRYYSITKRGKGKWNEYVRELSELRQVIARITEGAENVKRGD